MAEIKKQTTDIKKPVAEGKKDEKPAFAFGRINYILMFVGLGFLLLGYILMVGGGSDDPNVFSPSLFDFQRLTLAPILLVIGFIIEIFAIMKRPKAAKS
jgi:hypothetical protein